MGKSKGELSALAVAHVQRFREVSNRYPRVVTEAYAGDLVAAAWATDEQVAGRVAEWERENGIEPRDWEAIGLAERDDE
jgi:hypothetical protein